MTAVFVDTGYLLALEIANDQHHQAAARHWQGVVTALPRLVTTSYVFDEVVTFEESHPNIAHFVDAIGWIEVRHDADSPLTSFIRVIDSGGMVWDVFDN